MTSIKICGVKELATAEVAAKAGADLLGFNFHPPSPRYISPSNAAIIICSLRNQFGSSCPQLVGVFVEQSLTDILDIMSESGIDAAQLTGVNSIRAKESLSERSYVAIRPRNEEEANNLIQKHRQDRAPSDFLPSILIDAFHPKLFGGTGELISTDIAVTAVTACDHVLLAGGLTPLNVSESIKEIQPWGVDVASGVETSPGIKDANLIHDFISAVRGSGINHASKER